MNPKNELTDGSIIVRAYREEDARDLCEAARESIAEVSVWLPWCHENYSIEESQAFVRSRELASQGDEWYSFATFEKDSGRFLGGVGLNFFNRVHQMANLGYWVRTSAAGCGVATKATRLVARFGFEQLGLRRIEILAAVDNIASQRVAEKVGAVREGVLRKRLLINGESVDAVLFSLLPEDVGLSAGL
ncbi:MAG TPA: GNAT family protein [Pyrinomonadaceae bacterium]|nr:GNAT family protein [Pyrinomonadaceae bacterium]